jgi:hypothetical protein
MWWRTFSSRPMMGPSQALFRIRETLKRQWCRAWRSLYVKNGVRRDGGAFRDRPTSLFRHNSLLHQSRWSSYRPYRGHVVKSVTGTFSTNPSPPYSSALQQYQLTFDIWTLLSIILPHKAFFSRRAAFEQFYDLTTDSSLMSPQCVCLFMSTQWSFLNWDAYISSNERETVNNTFRRMFVHGTIGDPFWTVYVTWRRIYKSIAIYIYIYRHVSS